MSHDQTRIGLIGCGRWGRNILRDLQALGCVVDVVDPDQDARAQALERGAKSAIDHVADLANDHDGYVIAAWTTQHAPLIFNLIERGRPIFCEKPMTCDAADAEKIATSDSAVFVMHKWRYHPGVEALTQLASAGIYGAVTQINTRRLQWTTPHSDVDAIWSLTPHDLSMIYGILGHMPEPKAAAGVTDSDGTARSLVGIMGNSSEPQAVLHVAANWPTVERAVTVVFEEAVAVLHDPLADHIKLYHGRGGQYYARAPEMVHEISISTEYPLLRELRVFIEYLHGGPPPPTTAIEGALIVQTLAKLRSLAGLSA